MIYDCFTFFNELDLLEIRLEELKDVVDRFVLVEATKTFSNRPKRLFYEENKERFKAFHDRIIHIIVDDLPVEPKDSWENQFFQRNAINRGLVDCAPDDVILISDVDEIPRASAIAGFDGEIAFLEQNLYYYRLNCLCTTEKWAIPSILRYRNLTTPQEVRMLWYDQARRKEIPTIASAGWHFSYLGDAESIQLKLDSFSQQDFNTPEVNNREAIEKKIDAAQDLFDRPQYQWAFGIINETYPCAIYEKRFKYARYIKGRDLEGTVFFDQYSRYKACADILKTISDERATILDVGSGADCLMGEFLPSRDITFIDPLIANLPHRPSYKIAGDAFSKELDGRVFDYVISIDVLEHVPPEYRVGFLDRLSSLARKGLILAFPASDAGAAVETDAWLNSVYNMAYGKDYCWLEEHLQNGLPSLQGTIEQLQSLDWQTSVSQNGHTPWMRELLSFTLCGLEIEGFKQTVLELSTYFNHHLYAFDSVSPEYRQIVIATKPGALGLPAVTGDSGIITDEACGHWKFIQLKIAAGPYPKMVESTRSVKEKEQQLGELQVANTAVAKELAAKDGEIGRLNELAANERLLHEREIAAREQRIEAHGATIALLNEQLRQKERECTDKDGEIGRLNEQAAIERLLHEREIAAREQRIEALDATIALLNEQLRQRERECTDKDERIRLIGEELALEGKRLEEHLRRTDEQLVGKERQLRESARALRERETLLQQKTDQLLASEVDLKRIREERVAEQRGFEQRIGDREQQIQDLLNSKSWKITAPLRKALDLLHKK